MQILAVGKHPFFRTSLRVTDVEEPDLIIDARRLKFASPLELAGIAAMAHSASRDGQKVTFNLPEAPNLSSYIMRMDLLKHLDGVARILGEVPSEERTDRSDVLLELTRIERPEEAEELASRIVPLARAQATHEVTTAVFMGLGEFLDNACTHADSPIGVFAVAQAYSGETSGRRGLEVAVVDAGIGILEHLRRNAKYARLRRDETAIRYALQPGVSGTRDQRGYGFSDVLDEVRRAGLGRLVVRSGDGTGRVTVHHARERRDFARGETAVPGTWVWLRVRIP